MSWTYENSSLSYQIDLIKALPEWVMVGFSAATGAGPRRFTFEELVSATNFSNERKLGEGGFGAVYRGYLDDLDMVVAVKKISRGSRQGKKEYITEVKIISQLRHRYLVQLVGWCHDKGEFQFVYKFMPNGSLDSHLFGSKTLLTWTSSFNAKLGDFGLARLMDHELGGQTTRLVGTLGYMAPEYISTGRASKESDVFSFGVVALEIATGRKAIDPLRQDSEMSLVHCIWHLYESGEHLVAVDERLNAEFDRNQVECLMIVGLWCAHPDSSLRPSIRQVIQVLNFEAELPDLPRKMPVPVYVPTSSVSSSEPSITNSCSIWSLSRFTSESETKLSCVSLCNSFLFNLKTYDCKHHSQG
ncbi:hypothetical protein CRYUN_Cryun15aG0102300 [Craigia yunnanensis]